MAEKDKYKLSIEFERYSLNFDQIDNLMSEFYGECLIGTGSEHDEQKILEFEFDDENNIPKAVKALECFEIKEKL